MTYQTLSDDDLLNLLFTEEDRLPRVAVDEFIRRGERMVKPLSEIVSDQYIWTKALPEWWAVVHAMYILGGIGGKKVILPLLRGMRWAVAYDCDWVTEALPSIFGKIGVAAITGLKFIANDNTSDWYTRSIALEGLAAITISNPDIEADIFSFIHSILTGTEDDRVFKQTAGHILLDFLRSEYKDDLLVFGREERELKDKDFTYIHAFEVDDVEITFKKGKKDLKTYTKDWLSFYNEDEIRKRQERWEKEDEEVEDDEDDDDEDDWSDDDIYDLEPFVRESPKIGHNDPCPCGSGKKYKKCCIWKESKGFYN